MSRYVEFVECGFKNIFRYGASWTKFQFKDGLVNIFGKNGVGKSSVVEVIHYTLFGEAYRNVNLAKMINKVNKKGLETYINLKIHENGKIIEYLIVRGMEPKIEKIYVDGSDTALKIPGKFNTYISEQILGFNSNTNKKVISVHSKNGSFINMELEDRRKVIDSIVNLTQTKEYLKSSKLLLSEANNKKSILLADIEHNKKEIIPYQLLVNKGNVDKSIKIEECEKNIKLCEASIKDNRKTIKKLDFEKVDLEVNLDELTKKETELKQEYLKLNPNELNKQYMDLNSTLLFKKSKAKDKHNEINKIIPNSICDCCGNSYSVDQATNKRLEKQLELNDIISEGKDIKKLLDETLAQIENVKKEYEKVQVVSDKIISLKEEINNIKYSIRIEEQNLNLALRNLDSFKEKLKELNENEDVSVDVSSKLKELEDSSILLKNQYDEIVEEIESLQYIIKMFSDDGIKSLVLKKFLPILNRLINYYLKTFNISLKFEITSDYGYTMEASNSFSDDFEGLSGGQQQRINLAILFAQTDLIKIIGNFKTNLLFLDEYIDGAVDDEGLKDTFKILKQISSRDNKSIVIISHRLNDEIVEEFDHFYHAVSSCENFSELKEVDSSYVTEIMK